MSASAPGGAPPAGAGFDPRYAATARIGFGDPLPNPVAAQFEQFERVPTAGGQWATAVEKPKKSRFRSLIPLLTIVGIGVFGFFGWKYIQAYKNQPPEGTEAFAEGGGVPYAPAGRGYSVRLPSMPVEDVVNDSRTGVAGHTALSRGEGWELFVVAYDSGAIAPEHVEASLAGTAAGFAVGVNGSVEEQEPVDHDGHPALDVTIDVGDDFGIRMRLVHAGDHVYVMSVHSKGRDVLFDELVESFRIF